MSTWKKILINTLCAILLGFICFFTGRSCALRDISNTGTVYVDTLSGDIERAGELAGNLSDSIDEQLGNVNESIELANDAGYFIDELIRVTSDYERSLSECEQLLSGALSGIELLTELTAVAERKAELYEEYFEFVSGKITELQESSRVE